MRMHYRLHCPCISLQLNTFHSLVALGRSIGRPPTGAAPTAQDLMRLEQEVHQASHDSRMVASELNGLLASLKELHFRAADLL